MRKWSNSKRQHSTAVVALLALTFAAVEASAGVVISQVAGEPRVYNRAFVELFNNGSAPVDLSSWSVQFASATGTSWNKADLTGTIAPWSYYLVEDIATGGAGVNLPPTDDIGFLLMDPAAGKVALVSNTTNLSGSGCPFDPSVLDFVGYGPATCAEGSPADGIGQVTSSTRLDGGCVDTDDNAADFVSVLVTPHNSASPPHPCDQVFPLVVTTELDDYDGVCDAHCSLREALAEANRAPGFDVIELAAGSYLLTQTGPLPESGPLVVASDLDITDSLHIIGSGADSTVIDVQQIDRVFEVHGSAAWVTIAGLTVTGGLAEAGGGILVAAGAHVQLHEVVVTGNRASGFGVGGGILNEGELVVVASTVSNNTTESGRGGGITNSGVAIIRGAEISGNVTGLGGGNFGGGLSAYNGATTVIDSSSFALNVAPNGFGGAIDSEVSILVVTNSTFVGNSSREGGAVSVYQGDATLTHLTMAGNISTGSSNGIWFMPGLLRLRGNLIAGNCFLDGPVVSLGGNLESPGNTCGLLGPGDIKDVSAVDLALGTFADHGGATETVTFPVTSAARDHVTSGECPTTDQRGFRRLDQDCDVGSLEWGGRRLEPLAEDGQVNTTAAGSQNEPAVALSDAGVSLVAWTSPFSAGSDADSSSVQLQRFAADGSGLASELQVNSTTVGSQSAPAVSVGPAGDFVVVWQSDSSPGNDVLGTSILLQRFSSSGSLLGGEQQVNQFTAGDQSRPRVAHGPSSEFVVVWDSLSSTFEGVGYSVRAQKFDANGFLSGGEVHVNNLTTGDQRQPDVAISPSGDVVVAWTSSHSFDGDSDTSIQLRRYSSDGAPLTGQVQINGHQVGVQDQPRVAVDGSGRFTVVWRSETAPEEDVDRTSIRLRHFDASGGALGGDIAVNSYVHGYQSKPQLSLADDGGLAVAWQSTGAFADERGSEAISSVRFSADGTQVGPERRLNSITTGAQFAPSLAGNGSGDVVVAWASSASSGADTVGTSIQLVRLGNTCTGADSETDSDADSIPDSCDICPGFDDRVDGDGDGVPDGCDACPGSDDAEDADNDGIPDDCDVCPTGDDSVDSDDDGLPDDCDLCFGDNDTGDSDFDGVCDDSDQCPGEDDAVDMDSDGVPDACDMCLGDNLTGDADADGVCDDLDACPGADDGLDIDLDGVPDACDLCLGDDGFGDSDADGVCNDIDLCSGFPDWLDFDLDGAPDSCDCAPADGDLSQVDACGVCGGSGQPCPLYGEDFESGTANSWSSRVGFIGNLVAYPDFERGLTGWTALGSGLLFSASGSDSQEGDFSLQGLVTGPPYAQDRLAQDLSNVLAVGGSYRLQGWIKTDSVAGAGGALIAVEYVDAAGWTVASVGLAGLVTGTTGWAYYDSGVFVVPAVPAGATELWLVLNLGGNADSGGRAWWDGVSLTAVP